ncbi:MAG: ABC transporter ATP-binding protein/permease [Bacteroidales bacterium]|nr:ABC transporter ATP-binding protein/permease [Bacteroidales bacterium]
MKEFWQLLKRFVAPYKSYLAGSVFLNIFSAVFNVFSFSLIIPILQILFKMDTTQYQMLAWDTPGMGIKELALNNFYAFAQQLITNYGGSTTLLILGLFLGITTALKCACYFGSSAVMIPLRTGIVRDIRTQVYNKLMGLPMGFYTEERKGDIVARMSGDVNEVEYSIMSSLDMLIKNPILIIIYFATLIALSWQLTLFTVTVVPLLAWGMSALGKTLKRDSLASQAKWSDIMTQLDETLGGLRIIKAFIAEDKMSKRFEDTCNDFRDIYGKVQVRQVSAHPVSEFLGTCMIMLVLWFGGTLILNERTIIDAPTFIFYMIILYSVLQPLKEFSRAGYNIPKGLASMERIDKILLTENNIKELAEPEDLSSFEDSIEFKGVSFRYNGGAKEVLSDIDLKIGKGKTIALVGQSGSGKSTLVDLIPRYHDVTEGSITIDGKDVRNVRIKDLRSLIGNVNQEAILFNDTIFNNIAFGVEGATMEQVVAAAKVANAHDFIMEKENGYETMIGDRGGKLSGGQRQRISIARAILKNPPILILDEATSALDTESERLVQEALDRLTTDRTTIAIAHRLSTIRNADEICVMHEGKIVERGRHEELLALGGYYKKLNDMQAL